MHRRTFLGLGASVLAGAALAGWKLASSNGQPVLLSARDDAAGRHYAVAYRLDGQPLFATAVSQRCHDIVSHPRLPLALYVARRPGTQSYLLDLRDGRLLQTLDSPADRHFYGHAVFDRRGDWLYSTENDTRDPGRGVIGVYRLAGQRLQRHSELSSHGIGPHQLAWLPDGDTLVVANGGIRTEADSRTPLNADAMDSSLVLLDRRGQLLGKERLAQRQNSIRHLAVAADGCIVTAQQYQGDPADDAPLLAIKRPGQALQAFAVGETQRLAMQQYCASVAVNSQLRLIALSAPRGNRLFIWDMDSARLRLEEPLPDCAGVASSAHGFVASSGIGGCRAYDCRGASIHGQPLALPAGRWDNHLRLT
ncbi:DUF1513 domain-containing protein [Pseudomonas sp. N040]|uniref:DUF1513 domain-containing protein n=1 Tax=Pseudomonas sp. N040 TaxID=2785325 RepID=UPI0018A3324A|nr:DUF1513 domain-containing protein [Pseudomonas sp. N040]MBF7728472.1 DUF1513 domain-containing protein [Pseudomonas sp. N040]MBW7012112.1 DUF1513 domain-containing protein [Pseudomonas sp. N040]